jgi:hypothetical protein
MSMVGIILSVSEAAPHWSSAANNDARMRYKAAPKKTLQITAVAMMFGQTIKATAPRRSRVGVFDGAPRGSGRRQCLRRSDVPKLKKLRYRISPGMKRSLHQSRRSRSAFISKPVGTAIQSDGNLISWIIDRRTCYDPLASDLVVTSML